MPAAASSPGSTWPPEALPAVEYDGEEHDDALDRRRDLRTAALGRHTLRLLRRDLTATPDATVTLIRSLRDTRERMLRVEGYTTVARP